MATKAKFCENCGNKLTNGKCAKCDKASADDLKTSSSFTFQDILVVFKNILPRPMSTIRSLIKKSSAGLAWTLLVIASIFSGLACYFAFMQAGTMAGNNTLFFDSFWTIFFTAAVLSLIVYVLFALWSMIFVGAAFKGGGRFKDYLLVNAGAATFTVLFSAICIILGLANLPLIAAIVEIFATIAYVVLVIQGYREVANANDNTFAYGVSLAVIITGIISAFIAGFAFYQLGINVSTNATNKTLNNSTFYWFNY